MQNIIATNTDQGKFILSGKKNMGRSENFILFIYFFSGTNEMKSKTVINEVDKAQCQQHETLPNY